MKSLKWLVIFVVLAVAGCASTKKADLPTYPAHAYEIDAKNGDISGDDVRVCYAYKTEDQLLEALPAKLALMDYNDNFSRDETRDTMVDLVMKEAYLREMLENIYCLRRYEVYIPPDSKIRKYFMREGEIRIRYLDTRKTIKDSFMTLY